MKKHRNFILVGILTVFMVSCSENKRQSEEKKEIKKSKSFKIEFDNMKISKYTIEDIQIVNTKTIVGRMSNYTTKELNELPSSKRLTVCIVVPYEISKDILENTFKSIVAEKIKSDNDIDEIVIFAYDDKKDIGNTPYTFGKLLWSPNGKIGMMTPEIVVNKDRSNYKFDIKIKNKVGNIKKEDLPTKRELYIYNEIMNEKYIGMDDDKIRKIVMKKFKIKTKKEYEKIYLKVGVYKLF